MAVKVATPPPAYPAPSVPGSFSAPVATPKAAPSLAEIAARIERENPAPVADGLVKASDTITIDKDWCCLCGECCKHAPETFIPARNEDDDITAIMIVKAGFRANVEKAHDECGEGVLEYSWS